MSLRTAVRKAFRAAQSRDFVEAFRMLQIHASTMGLQVPTSLVLDEGTSSDALADLTTMLDGNVYQINEVIGAPGQSLTLTFAVVREIYGLLFRAYYSGSGTHYCEVQLYNYTTSAWDTYTTVENSNGYNTRYIRIPDDADYVQANVAQVRWYHPVSGNASHDSFIDYIALEG